MSKSAFAFERTITIRAERSTVFRFLSDSSCFERWLGKGSEIEPREGGRVMVRFPGDTTASGTVLEIQPDERIVFTYGYDGEGKPIAPGGSRVAITVADDPEGTRLTLVHEVDSDAVREMHEMGWRHQLAVLAHAAAREQHTGLEAKIDRWFELWGEHDPNARKRGLGEIAIERVTFRDAWGCVTGLDELSAHIGAIHVHMPAQLGRSGSIRAAHGTAVSEWTAIANDREVMRGSNLFVFAPDGRIQNVVGMT